MLRETWLIRLPEKLWSSNSIAVCWLLSVLNGYTKNEQLNHPNGFSDLVSGACLNSRHVYSKIKKISQRSPLHAAATCESTWGWHCPRNPVHTTRGTVINGCTAHCSDLEVTIYHFFYNYMNRSHARRSFKSKLISCAYSSCALAVKVCKHNDGNDDGRLLKVLRPEV